MRRSVERTRRLWKTGRRYSALVLAVAALVGALPSEASADYREGRVTVGDRMLTVGFDSDEGTVSVELTPVKSAGTAVAALSSSEWIDATMRTDCETPVPGLEPWGIVVSDGSASLDPGAAFDWTQNGSTDLTEGALFVEFGDADDRMPPAAWRCVKGKVNGTPFTFYFDGYSAFSPQLARDAMLNDLDATYPTAVMRRLAYAKCPALQFLASDDASYCVYQIGRGRNVRAGSYLVKMPKGFGDPVARRSYSVRYSQRLVDCPSKYERSIANFSGAVGQRLIAQRLRAPRAECGASYLWDVPSSATRAVKLGKRSFVGWTHGTNTGGFDDMNRYRCRFRVRQVSGGRRYRVRCANKLGDRSTYAFTVRTKRAKPRRASGGSGESGGGSSGPYSGKTCDEIGHSYTVPPGTDREHDADGDGVACEAQG